MYTGGHVKHHYGNMNAGTWPISSYRCSSSHPNGLLLHFSLVSLQVAAFEALKLKVKFCGLKKS